MIELQVSTQEPISSHMSSLHIWQHAHTCTILNLQYIIIQYSIIVKYMLNKFSDTQFTTKQSEAISKQLPLQTLKQKYAITSKIAHLHVNY